MVRRMHEHAVALDGGVGAASLSRPSELARQGSVVDAGRQKSVRATFAGMPNQRRKKALSHGATLGKALWQARVAVVSSRARRSVGCQSVAGCDSTAESRAPKHGRHAPVALRSRV